MQKRSIHPLLCYLIIRFSVRTWLSLRTKKYRLDMKYLQTLTLYHRPHQAMVYGLIAKYYFCILKWFGCILNGVNNYFTKEIQVVNKVMLLVNKVTLLVSKVMHLLFESRVDYLVSCLNGCVSIR